MGHMVRGVIAINNDIMLLKSKSGIRNSKYQLNERLSLLPLTDSDVLSISQNSETEIDNEFSSMSERFLRLILGQLIEGSYLFFETEYFGGDGAQSAVLISNGKITFGPTTAEIGPINYALSKLGVIIGENKQDEFDTIGLDKFRSTETWLDAAEKQNSNHENKS